MRFKDSPTAVNGSILGVVARLVRWRLPRIAAVLLCVVGFSAFAASSPDARESSSRRPAHKLDVLSAHKLDVLRAHGISGVRFGASPRTVRTVVDSLLGQASGPYKPAAAQCGVNHSIVWPDDRTATGLPKLVAYFGHSKFVGYQYGEFGTMTRPHPPIRGVELATARGLRIGDTLARGRTLYGPAFRLSSAQGGTWKLGTGRVIRGYAWGHPKDGDVSWQSLVATIDAGDVGCPALSP
jgi:hypothetical protein